MSEQPPAKIEASGDAAIGVAGNAENSHIEAHHHDNSHHTHYHGLTGSAAILNFPAQRHCQIPLPPMGEMFAGRKALLQKLEALLRPGEAASLHQAAAVRADGGVGKTSLAVELGYRLFAEGKFDYVLFLNASTSTALDLDLSALCAREKLNLPEQAATEAETRLAGVLAFLGVPENARRALLIFDGPDSEDAAERVRRMRAQLVGCSVLVTSRRAIGGRIKEILLDYFTPEESREFLHQRLDDLVGVDAGAEARLDAIAAALDHYPLALEMAASRMREFRLTPLEWLREWEAGAAAFLEHHNRADTEYRSSLSRVWDQSLAGLPAAALQQLHLLAWFAPRPVTFPVALLRDKEGWATTRAAFAELEKRSLIQWTMPEDKISIHRVLQVVMQRTLQPSEKAAALDRARMLLERILPKAEFDIEGWLRWEELSPHLQALLTGLRDAPEEAAASGLMNQIGKWQFHRALYAESEPLLRRAWALDEKSYGGEHPRVAIDLNNLAQLLQDTNRLAEAEPLMRRALAIDEKIYGGEHSRVSIELNNLAQLLKSTNRLGEAEPLMRRALAIDEKSYGGEHPKVATRLNNLAQLLQATNRLGEAEPLMRRALAIDEKSYGREHPKVAIELNNLAQLLQATNRLGEAEPLMRRALAIDEKSYGGEHPNVASGLNNLATLLQVKNRLEEAEPMLRRALAIDEKSYGGEHPKVAIELNNLAQLLQATNRQEEAELLMRRALAIDEKSYGGEHPNVAIHLNNLAWLLRATKQIGAAEPLSRRHMEIFLYFTFRTGHQHPHLQAAFGNYGKLLEEMGWTEEAIKNRISRLVEECRARVAHESQSA